MEQTGEVFPCRPRQLPNLNRGESLESNPGDKPKPPKKLPAKAPNFASKAQSKIKEARAMETDAKILNKKFEDEKKKKPDDAKM